MSYALLIKKYEADLRSRPADAELHYSLGVAYAQTDQLRRALLHFDQASTLNPHHKNALFNLASGYETLGRAKLAIAFYQKLLDEGGLEEDMDKYVRQRLAVLYQKTGRHLEGNLLRQN